jgi:hypothetical protein
LYTGFVPYHLRKKGGTMERFFDSRVAAANPEDGVECAAALLKMVLDRAREDLASEKGRHRLDAYYWLTSPRSDLYTFFAQRFQLPICPDGFRQDILGAGLPDFPAGGIETVEMDTDTPTDWCYSQSEESVSAYANRVARCLVEGQVGEEIEVAALNGCDFAFSGGKSWVLESAVSTFLRCRADGCRRKTVFAEILGSSARPLLAVA